MKSEANTGLLITAVLIALVEQNHMLCVTCSPHVSFSAPFFGALAMVVLVSSFLGDRIVRCFDLPILCVASFIFINQYRELLAPRA